MQYTVCTLVYVNIVYNMHSRVWFLVLALSAVGLCQCSMAVLMLLFILLCGFIAICVHSPVNVHMGLRFGAIMDKPAVSSLTQV